MKRIETHSAVRSFFSFDDDDDDDDGRTELSCDRQKKQIAGSGPRTSAEGRSTGWFRSAEARMPSGLRSKKTGSWLSIRTTVHLVGVVRKQRRKKLTKVMVSIVLMKAFMSPNMIIDQ